MIHKIFFALLLLTSQLTFADADVCLGDTTLEISKVQATVEVAASERERRYGLMFRNKMGENCGMLFVFQNSGFRTFTMQNTLIPLDIAFIDEVGTIKEIFSMQPGVSRYPSKVKSTFALEMNEGWFEKNSLSVGDTITIKTEQTNTPLSELSK